MGKVLKPVIGITAGLVVGVVTGNPLAGLAVGGSIIGGKTVGTILGAPFGLAGIAIGRTLGKTFNKPSMDMSAAVDRLNAGLDPQAYGKWVFGETICATDLVYADNGGTDDRYITQVFHGASHEIDDFLGLYIDDELAVNSAGTVQAGWSGIIAYGGKLGTDPQTALSIGNSFWPTGAKGEGLAHFYLNWDLKDGEDKLSGGLPTRITAKVKGAPVYDPRLDTTVGGSGAHRANDQSTWQYNDGTDDIGGNWALLGLQYLLGWHTAAGDLVWGLGADPDTEIDYDSFIAAANICDETVDGKPRFRVGGAFPTTQNHEQIVEQFEAAIGGKIAKVGGKYYCWVPNDDLTSQGTITDDDLVRAAGVEFEPSGPIENLYNTCRGRFIDPDLLYQPNHYPEVVESTAVTEDGRERVKEHDFSIIQDVEIAERVARYLVRRSRFSGSWRFAVGPKGLLYKPFDVITINLPETNNTDTLVRIINMEYSAQGIVAMEVIEEDSSIYDTTSPLGTPVTQNDPDAFDPNKKIAVSGLAAADVSIAGSGGTAKDALKVTWNDPGGYVRSTDVQYRVKGTTDWQTAETQRLDFTQVLIVGVNPSTIYEVRARHITLTGTKGDWTAAVEETSGATETALTAGDVPFDNVSGTNKPEDNATKTPNQTENLFTIDNDGGSNEAVASTLGTSPTDDTARRIYLSEVGLEVGDTISASAEVRSSVNAETVRLVVRFYDATDTLFDAALGTYFDPTGWTRTTIDDITIPATTSYMTLIVQRNGATAEIGIRKQMINRGAVAADYAVPKRGATKVVNLVDNKITTDSVTAKAITDSFYAELASDQTLTYNSAAYQEITGLQLTFTSSSDSETSLLFMVTLTVQSWINDDDRWSYDFKCTRDTTTVHERIGAFQVPPKDITTTPASESHTLAFTFELAGTGTEDDYEFFIKLGNNERTSSVEYPGGSFLEAVTGSSVIVLERQR